MAQNPSPSRKYKDLQAFPDGVNSYLDPQLIKDTQIRWAENAVNRGGVWQTRPGFLSRFAACLTVGTALYNWWVAAGQPILHPQFFTIFTPSNSTPYAVFGISGAVFYSGINSDGSISSDPVRITNINFSPSADQIATAKCVKSSDIIAGVVVNITPQNILIMQDGDSRAGYWNGLASGQLNPEKNWTVDSTGNTIFTPGYNQTRMGLWMAWSGNRLWVSDGTQAHASDLNDPLNFTEETVLTQIPVFNFPEPITAMIDRGTSGVQDGLVFIFTEKRTWAIHSGIQDRTKWITTNDFQRTVFAGVGCVAGKSPVNHRGLLYWYSNDGVVSFDTLGTVISTQALPAIDYEMQYSKRRMSPNRGNTCVGVRDAYVFWSVPIGPTENGRCYNGQTQALDRMTIPIPSPYGGLTPSGITSWQGVWTGIRPIEWATESIAGQERAYAMSMDYDGNIRIWEAFQGNRADNGYQIPWAIETKSHPVTESPFIQTTFSYFQLLMEQIIGNLEVVGSYKGLRGQYHELLNTSVTATPGSVLLPLPTYSPVIVSTPTVSFAKQFRSLKSQMTLSGGTEPACTSAGVESQNVDAIDRAFSLLIRCRGVGAILAYRLALDDWPEDTEGEVVDPEDGFHILPETACPEFVPGVTPDYRLQSSPAADALTPYLPRFAELGYRAPVDPCP